MRGDPLVRDEANAAEGHERPVQIVWLRKPVVEMLDEPRRHPPRLETVVASQRAIGAQSSLPTRTTGDQP